MGEIIKMLNELKNRNVRKIEKKSLKNEKVRVGDVKIFEGIMKRCRKESSMMGRGLWRLENRVKEREFFDLEFKGIGKKEVYLKKI